MNHKTAVNVLMLVALFCVTRLAYATTFMQEVMVFDYPSLLAAIASGFFGGLFKTIYTLQNDERVVFAILKEARKDLVKSCLAGGAAYLLMIAIESWRPGTITREMRFVGVMAAGWTRDWLFTATARMARAGIDRKVSDLRGGVPATDPPTSAAVPLGDK